jgi:hypothetical protein
MSHSLKSSKADSISNSKNPGTAAKIRKIRGQYTN